jgi:hypothetical protein
MKVKQIIRNGKLITTTEREIHERRAVITKITVADTVCLKYEVFQDGVRYIGENWQVHEVPTGVQDHLAYRMGRLREYIESVQFGGRVNLGWTRVGDTWVTDTLLGDSGGNGFTPEELELIRQSRAIKRPTRTRNRERKASREEQHARYIDCGPAAWDDR